MMQQYRNTKKEYEDCILFYRLGDFYEMFFDDALTASRELEITLTGKDCGLEERAPMCGVPYHAAETYLNRLVQKGYKVAIAEQVEDPKAVKGIVKREVVRVVTPGTILNATALDEGKNNYLMAIFYVDGRYGISIADVTTGDYFVTEMEKSQELLDEIYKFTPSEIIYNHAFCMSGTDLEHLENQIHFVVSALEDRYFNEENCQKILIEHFHAGQLSELGLEAYPVGLIASGALMQYLYETQKTDMSHITALQSYTVGKYMIIDTSTRRNLELTETLREKQKKGSLLWVLDKTKTAMGARLLRNYIEQPLIDRSEILKRQQAVAELGKHYILREELREYLNSIYDLERLIGRISYCTANPRDLIAFKNSLEMIPYIKQILKEFQTPALREIEENMDSLEDIYELIEQSIVYNPPIAMKEGGIIK